LKTKIAYAVIALATIAAYPHIVNLLNLQFSVYQIHMGNPASYILVFVVFAWWFDSYYKAKWGKGKMGWRGYAWMVAGFVVITLLLKYVFGYQLRF
jgi:hypothetical protein